MKAKADSKRAVSGEELAAIWNSPAEIRDAVFIHRTICQVGFAREDPKQGRMRVGMFQRICHLLPREEFVGLCSSRMVSITRPVVPDEPLEQ
jgi:hypothetical protein